MKLTFQRMTREPWSRCHDCHKLISEFFNEHKEWFYNWRKSAKIKALCSPCYELRRVVKELGREMYGGPKAGV